MTLRIVSLSEVLPSDAAKHAGGRLAQEFYRLFIEADPGFVALVPASPQNRRAVHEPGAPRHVLVGDPESTSAARRWGLRSAALAQDLLGRARTILPELTAGLTLHHDQGIRSLLRAADVIDMQWERSAHWATWLRRLNPGARLVAVLHDVDSQRWDRKVAGSTGPRRWYFLLRRSLSSREERRICAAVDTCLVLSEKDAGVLRATGCPEQKIDVCAPPFAEADRALTRHPDPATAVFVSYLARQENIDALTLLRSHIWPQVREKVPEAELLVVGHGSAATQALVEESEGMTWCGFVDSLDEVYERATVAVIPLMEGAGVKFKCVEAVLWGIPTVTTPIGAEGIGGDEVFWCVSEDPDVLARAVVSAMTAPGDASGQAAAAASLLRERYSRSGFASRVRHAYGLPPGDVGRRA